MIDRSQAIEAERARRAEQAEAEAFGQALVRLANKPRHRAIIDAIHGSTGDERSVILRACIVCGKPSPSSYCSDHTPKPWATSKRRAQLTVSGSVEQARRKRVLSRYLHCCHVCGRTGADQVDHVVPLSEGGADDESNLASIHAEPCHREKTAAEARRARA